MQRVKVRLIYEYLVYVVIDKYCISKYLMGVGAMKWSVVEWCSQCNTGYFTGVEHFTALHPNS